MSVDVKLKIDYEKRSMIAIKFDDVEHHITDKEAESMLKQLYDYRPDLFEECDYTGKKVLETKIETLEQDNIDLESRVNDLEDDVERLESENEELNTYLDQYR